MLDSTYLPAKPKSVLLAVLLLDNILKLSFVVTAPVCVVVPDTVKFPETVRLLLTVTSLGKPTVIVPDDSETSTSLLVPANVIVPPKAVAVEFEPSDTVIDEFANLEFAIEPANLSFAIEPAN